ncbi:DNA-processing protein DprA [Phaeocystidibacter luteus]|uniref:DNA-protecting protein DprA n=1 Tax=Phaeocystidibacter luteus TaxID=911197 RepID=A0A6N6RIX0_9FLAO|nr:DNA-processing protein DprA [Phaeocystidibacter luteus]KAB2805399.1 DNA-protecting protein DprA [Phaeocystidibacter luteus]
MDEDENLYRLGLCFVDLIGPIIARTLVNYCGSATAIFEEKAHLLSKIPGVGEERAKAFQKSSVLIRAQKEMEFCFENDIRILFFTEEVYPRRLLHCSDAPVLLFSKGKIDLNPNHAVAVVGTRSQSNYGKVITEKLVDEWAVFKPQIISGLALGIDTTAHRAALKNELETVAVLGHSLDLAYPFQNKNLFTEIAESGALISEFPSGTKPDAPNFPRRNRIVAGMTDATVVVEAAQKGGALITGQLASSYQRDVFAVPGRVNDAKSAGCLNLIKNNEAIVLTTPQDVPEVLGWQTEGSEPVRQMQLPVDLSTEEAGIISALRSGSMQVDELGSTLGRPISQLFALLTQLELKGIVRSRPGKKYELA